MPRSMTGFGRGEAFGPFGRVAVEAKAVNNRFTEVAIRLPRQLSILEDRVRKAVQQGVARGRVDVHITWEPAGFAGRRIQVDKDLALAYYSALKEIGEAIGSKVEISVDSLAKLPDVLTIQDTQLDMEALWPTMAEAVAACVAGLTAMREREGATLGADLAARIVRIGEWVGAVRDRTPAVVGEYRERLQRRLDELLAPGVTDPARLAQEVAIFADRCDITEELERLSSHLAQFAGELAVGREAAGNAVGRKLDFLVQELNREINTIGSKAQDTAISAVVLEVKAELERIKEQVQNIE